jgi:hypothetical protein
MAVTATLEPERGVLTHAQVEAIKEGREFLFAYGVVRYRDVFDRPHETRFAYAYRTADTRLVMRDGGKIETVSLGKAVFEHGGPAAYNLVT